MAQSFGLKARFDLRRSKPAFPLKMTGSTHLNSVHLFGSNLNENYKTFDCYIIQVFNKVRHLKTFSSLISIGLKMISKLS